jgi:hypothetical protein
MQRRGAVNARKCWRYTAVQYAAPLAEGCVHAAIVETLTGSNRSRLGCRVCRAIQPTPLKHLVGVDSVRLRYPRHRRARHPRSLLGFCVCAPDCAAVSWLWEVVHRPVQTAITVHNATLTAARGREQGSRRARLLDELLQDRTDLNPRTKSFTTYLTKRAELLDRAHATICCFISNADRLIPPSLLCVHV